MEKSENRKFLCPDPRPYPDFNFRFTLLKDFVCVQIENNNSIGITNEYSNYFNFLLPCNCFIHPTPLKQYLVIIIYLPLQRISITPPRLLCSVDFQMTYYM